MWRPERPPEREGEMSSRKDFEATARIIRAARLSNIITDEGQRLLTEAFVKVYEQENPRFNVNRFALACGLDEYVKVGS